MSLVADVLQSAGKLAKEDVVSKVYNLKQKVEDIKLELHESLKNRYIEFLPQYVKLDKLLLNLSTASKEYEVLRSQIEEEVKPQMTTSVTEFHNVIEDLRKIRALKEVVGDLAALHQHLEKARSFLFQTRYHDATKEMIKFDHLFKVNNTEDVEICCALKTEFYVTKEEMIYQLEKIWKQNVSIIRIEEIRKQGFQILITLKKCSAEEYIDLLASLKFLNELKPMLKKFGKKFLTLVCETLLSNKISIQISNKNDNCHLNISIINNISPEPSEVFCNLDKIFRFLHSELFYLPSSTDDGAKTLMNELGDVLSDDFCLVVIEKCLKPAVPKHSQGLEGFNKEIESVHNFNNVLSEIGFFSSEKNKLQHFIEGVDTLPVDKMAQDFLSRSRSIMKQSLHQTVSVGIEESATLTSSGKVSGLVEMTEMKSSLSKSTFAFPRCEISVSAKNLVQLLQEIMKEAKNVGITHSTRLYYIAHKICDLYSFIMPTYHKNEIETIPQQTAIFHNNCMFIAHNLLMLGTQYECGLRVSFPMTFVDLVPRLRKLGIEPYLAQMRCQKKQLLELIQDRQAFKVDETTEDALVNKAEKAIRQCLCQLQLLKKAWSPVLPSEVYFKSIGTLLNSCLEEIALHILAMEDITAENAAQLDSIFAILLKESPDLFKISSVDKQNLVHNYVRHWFKFQELQLVLSCSMKEIVDRWASGKGPLASHFTADEIKHLIRALFQNTERRAASLAKIR